MKIKSLTEAQISIVSIISPITHKENLAHAYITLKELKEGKITEKDKIVRAEYYFKNRIETAKQSKNKIIQDDVKIIELEFNLYKKEVV